jgi:membrane protein
VGAQRRLEETETRGFVRRRLVAFAMAGLALVAFALVFGLLVLGPHLARWVGSATGEAGVVHAVWWAAEWPLLVLVLLACFAGLLALGPDVESCRRRVVSLSHSATAVALWLGGSGLFALYVSRFGSYDKAWGTLSAVVVMLTWLWLGGVAVLLGAEIDAE